MITKKIYFLVITSIILLLVYFASRLQNLNAIPVFGDEAIYVRWSQLIKNVDTLRFVPQSDGKQPLFMWLTAATFKYISNPLTASRTISVISGSIVLITLYLTCLIYFNPTTAIISSLLYITLPFTFFFDRLAVPDTMLSAFGIISLLFSLLLAKYPRLDLSLLLGFSLGLSWLTKSPAIYFVVLSLATFLVYRQSNYKKIYFPLISACLGFVIYNILRLGPQFQQIALRNRDYIWSFSEIIKHPLDPLIPHVKDIFSIYNNYISIPIIILTLIGTILFFHQCFKNKTVFIIFCWWILPLIANAGIAKVFTARYILFTVPPLIILLSISLSAIFTKFSKLQILMFLCLIPNLLWIYNLSTNPFKLNLSSTETGYISGWTSGWGIKTAADYLIQRSRVANVIVGTEGYFGTLPDGLQIYTDRVPQLTIFGVGIDINQIPEKLIDARNHQDEVYLLFNSSRLKLPPSELQKLTLISAFTKPQNDSLVLYRLN